MGLTKPTLIGDQTVELPLTPPRYIAIETGETAQAVFEEVKAAKYISFDTETRGLGRLAEVFGITFTLNGATVETGGMNPTYVPGNTYWYRFGLDDVADEIMRDTLRYIFSDEGDLSVIMHNGKFDIVAIRNTFGVRFQRRAFNDTMIMAQVLARFTSASLKSLCSYVLNKAHGWDAIVDHWFAYQKKLEGKRDKVPGSNAVKSRKRGEDKDYSTIPEMVIFPYACTDAEYTFELFFKMREYFRKEEKGLQLIYKLERSIVPVAADIEFEGQLLDTVYLMTLAEEVAATVDTWFKEFEEMWGQPDEKGNLKFNPGSPKQLISVLYGKDKSKNQLGLPVIAKTPTGQPQTGGDVLEKLASYDERVMQIVRYQRCSRALSTMQQLLELCINTPRGTTIHTDYFQVLVSGRFSSRNPNLQNLINDDRGGYRRILPGGGDISIRRAFVAPKGFLYVKADYSAFELRWIANACKDPLLVEMLQAGVDLHSWLGAKLYASELDHLRNGWNETKIVLEDNRPFPNAPVPGELQDSLDSLSPEQRANYNHNPENDWHTEQVHHDPDTKLREMCGKWDEQSQSDFAVNFGLDWRYFAIKSKATTRLKEMRTNVKVCSFAIVYGAGPKKISETFNVPLVEAEALRDIYFRSFPTLDAWRKQVNIDTDRTRKVYTLFGRKRQLSPTDYVGTTAVNHIIQGTAADWLKFSMLDIHALLYDKVSYMSATIHDEVQICLHHTEFDLLPQIVACMEANRAPDIMPIPMIAEVSASRTNWADCKELDHSAPLVPQLQALWEKRDAANELAAEDSPSA